MPAERPIASLPFKGMGHIIKEHEQSGRFSRTFDGKYTHAWFDSNSEVLQAILNEKLMTPPVSLPPVEDPHFLHLNQQELGSLAALFPLSARLRSRAIGIKAHPTLWTHRDLKPGDALFTSDPKESLASTATVLGRNRTTPRNGSLYKEIDLFEIPPIHSSPLVPRLMQAAAFVHEYTHAFTEFNNCHNIFLKLPDGTTINSYDFIYNVFSTVINGTPPLSQYTAGYRKAGERYTDLQDNKQINGLSEELAEALTISVLGYNIGSFPDIRNDPLEGYPALQALIHDFLHAQEVTTEPTDAIIEEPFYTALKLIRKYFKKST